MRNKLIINAALTGMVPTKSDNPYLPVTPEEIAAETRRVYELGASIVHIHARDKNGMPTHSKEVYGEIIDRIRQVCPDIIITVSTSGRGGRSLEERMGVLDLEGDYKPDMASLTLGSMNFMCDYSLNPPEVIRDLVRKMKERNIVPELEIFDTGMANYAKYLIRKGLLGERNYANLILGSLGSMPATGRNLVHLIGELPEETVWAGTGIGRFAFDIQCLAVALGGGVRVGLEDCLWMDMAKTEPATNLKLVERVVRVAEAMGRDIATAQEVRELLDLSEFRGFQKIQE